MTLCDVIMADEILDVRRAVSLFFLFLVFISM